MKTERHMRRQHWLVWLRACSWATIAILVLALPACARREATLGILAGTLIDGADETVRRDALIVVEDRTIREIIPASEQKAYRFDRFIDASSRHVIPGLFDMHGHVTMTRRTLSADATGAQLKVEYRRDVAEWVLGQLLSYGITTVRETADFLEEGLELQQDLRSGAIKGPRIFTCGPLIEGDHIRALRICPAS